MASGVIPQITAVFGTCGGGLGLFPTMTDFTFMEEKNAKLFVNAPNALDGNVITKCDSSSAKFQAEESGIVDVVADEATILEKVRELVSFLPANNEDDASFLEDCTDDLNRVNPEIAGRVGDTSVALSILADDNNFFEVKAGYAKNMVTGFLRLDGVTVGAVANRSEICDEEGKVAEKLDAVLTAEGCEKVAEFVNFCDAFGIPVLTLTNVKGYEATLASEKAIAKVSRKADLRICQRYRSQGERCDRQGSGNRLCGNELQGNRCGYHHGMAGCTDWCYGRQAGRQDHV